MGKRTGDEEGLDSVIGKADIARTPHVPVVTADGYSATVCSLIKELEDASKNVGKVANLSSALRHLLQSRCDPPSILWWTLIAAEKSASLDMTKTDSLEIAKEILHFAWKMFELVKSLTSTTSSGRAALSALAPVVGLLFDAASLISRSVASFHEREEASIGKSKQLNKSLRKLQEFLRVFLGYVCICRCKESEGFRRSPALSLPPGCDSIVEKFPEHLYPEFPLVSKTMRKLLSKKPFDTKVLAEVVVVQGILLQLAVELIGLRLKPESQGTNRSAKPPLEFIEELKNLAIHSVSATGASVVELLLDTLREKALPVLDLLDEKEEAIIRWVLFETVVVDRPLFSAYAEDYDGSASLSGLDHDCVLYMKKLFTARKAIIFFRSQGSQSKSVSFIKQMTSWSVPPTLLRWLKSLENQHVPLDILQDNQALTRWLVNTADKSTFKDIFRLALGSAVCVYVPAVEKTDVDESKPESDDAETVFFVDTTGDGDTGRGGPNSQPEAVADAEFTAAAKSIKGVSGRKKRKKPSILFNRQGSPSADARRRPRMKLNAESEDIEMKAGDSDGDDDLTAAIEPEVEAPPPSSNDGLDGKKKRKRRKRGEDSNIPEQGPVSLEDAGKGASTEQADLAIVEVEPQEHVATANVRTTADGEENNGLPDVISSRKETCEGGIALRNRRKSRNSAKKKKVAVDSDRNDDLSATTAPEGEARVSPSLNDGLDGKKKRNKRRKRVAVSLEIAGKSLSTELVDPRNVDMEPQEYAASLDVKTTHGEASNGLFDLVPSRKETSLNDGLDGKKKRNKRRKRVPVSLEIAGKGLSTEPADPRNVGMEPQGYAETTAHVEASNGVFDLVPSRKETSEEGSVVPILRKSRKSAKKKKQAIDNKIHELAAVTPEVGGEGICVNQGHPREVNWKSQESIAVLDVRIPAEGGASNELSGLTPSRKDASVSEGGPEEEITPLTARKLTKSAKKKNRAMGFSGLLAKVTRDAVEKGMAKQVDVMGIDLEPQGYGGGLDRKTTSEGDMTNELSELTRSRKDTAISASSPEEGKMFLNGRKPSKSAKKKIPPSDSEIEGLVAAEPEITLQGTVLFDTKTANDVDGNAANGVSASTSSRKDIFVLEGCPEEENMLLTGKKLMKSAQKKNRALDSESRDLAAFAPQSVEVGVPVEPVDVAGVDEEPQGFSKDLDARIVADNDASTVPSVVTPLRNDISVLEGSSEEKILLTGKKLTKSAKKKVRDMDSEMNELGAVSSEIAGVGETLKQVEVVDVEPQVSTAGFDTRTAVDDEGVLLPVMSPSQIDIVVLEGSPKEQKSLPTDKKSAKSAKKKRLAMDSEIHEWTAVAPELEHRVSMKQVDPLEEGVEPRKFSPDLEDPNSTRATPLQKDVSVLENFTQRRSPITGRKSSKSIKKQKPPTDGEIQKQAAVAPDFAGEGASIMQADAREVDVYHDGPTAVVQGVLTADANMVAEGRIANTQVDEVMSVAHKNMFEDHGLRSRSSLCSTLSEDTEKRAEVQISGTVESETTQKETQQPGPVSTPGRKKRPKSDAHKHGRDDEHRIRDSIMNEVVDMSASVSGADLIDALQTQVDEQNDDENLQASRKKIKLRDTGSNETEQVGAVRDRVTVVSPAVGNKTQLVVYSHSGDGTDKEWTSASKILMGADDLIRVPSIGQGSPEALMEYRQGTHVKVATGLPAPGKDRPSHPIVCGASVSVKVTVATNGVSKEEVQVLPALVASGEAQEHRGEDDKGDGPPKVEVLDLLSATPERPLSRKGKVTGDRVLPSECETPQQTPKETPSGRLSPRRTRSGRELGTPQTPVSKRKPRKKLEMQPPLEE